MFKSIFGRYFLITITTIVVCFFILGIALLTLTGSYSVNREQTALYNNARDISKIVSNMPYPLLEDQKLTPDNSAEIRILQNTLSIISENGQKVLILVDADSKNCILLTKDTAEFKESVVDSRVISAVSKNGIYRSSDRLYGLFSEKRYTVGVTMDYRQDGKMLTGYVFVSSPADSFLVLIYAVSRFFLLSFAGVMVISVLMIYLLTKEIVRPIKDIKAVLEEFSAGNFSRRVRVTGQTEMTELCTSFNQMADSLEQLENSRRSFMANISHDLKTPLTSIYGFIEGILDGTIPADRQNEYLERVSKETKRLTRIVNSMLDISRLEAGEFKLNKTSFNLSYTLNQTVFSFERLIEEKDIALSMNSSEKIYVNADEDLVSRVLVNIIGNAVKYTNQGGNIEIDTEKDSDYAYVSVSNSGDGIPKEDLPYVFERFYKSDKSRSLDKDGMGLGLYISKMFVELNGGTISVQSDAEKTLFRFSLELSK